MKVSSVEIEGSNVDQPSVTDEKRISDDSRRIAFCGTRGLPANYGGFETAVDEISRYFVQAGSSCDVFCRLSHHSKTAKEDNGRHLIYVKGSTDSKLDTFVSSFQTGFFLIKNREKYQHVFWFNNANFFGILLTHLAGIPFTVNTDGLEWRRKKWSWPFKLYYFITSLLLARLCKRLISDSIGIQAYYRTIFKRETIFIPYGSSKRIDVPLSEQDEILSRYGLEKGKYFLQITRIEPDNLPYEVAQGFQTSKAAECGYRFVSVGYQGPTPYAEKLQQLSGEFGILLLPAIYEPKVLATLRMNCHCYVHGNSVGGTNPALLEAMTACPRILAIDTPFSHEVLGNHGNFFSLSSIADDIDKTLQTQPNSDQLQDRVFSNYQWEEVAASYYGLVQGEETLYQQALLKSVIKR